MAKKSNFKDWMEKDQYEDNWSEDAKFRKKDSKRYDKKKASIQNARKRKSKLKNSYFDGI